MDVLNDARDILDGLGVHVETNANEAGAAAMLGASINYPMRGAVAFKSTVGTNVASDALSNLASAGVKGGDAHRARRGLRRGRLDHPGAQPRLRHEVADVAARPAPQPAEDRRDGRAGLRAVGSLQHAGDARAAHPRLPRAGQLQDQEATRRRRSRRRRSSRTRTSTTTASACRPRPTLQEKQKIDVRWPAAVEFIRERKLERALRRGDDRTSASSARAASTTR